MSIRLQSALVIVFASLLVTGSVGAQEDGDDITIGTWRMFESELLGETRRLNIGLPAGYNRGDERYPVLYLLDGPYHFHHTTGLAKFLARENVIPNLIVVAVGNTNRTRDMTPPTRDTKNPMAQDAGGAGNFLAFFRDELIPFIDGEYRTQPYRVLIGHSLGGLFAIHGLVHEPDVFDGYVAISPSLWWDDQLLIEQAEELFSNARELKKTLYMTMGSESGDMRGGMLKLEGVLTEHTPKDFEWSSRVMKEETHTSVPYRSTQQGLEYIFRHWGLKSPMTLYEQGGIEAVYAFFNRAENRYGIKRNVPPQTFFTLAADLAESGRLHESRSVLEHDPENLSPPPMLYEMLADDYDKLDDKEGVIACYSRILELNPANEKARKKLAELGVDAEAIAPAPAAISPELLAEYEGTYVLTAEGEEMTVTLADDHLEIEGGVPSASLKPLVKDRFIIDGQQVEVVFTRNDAGRVVKLKAMMGSQVLGEAERKE